MAGAGESGPPAMQGKPFPGAMDNGHKTPETAAAAAETIQEGKRRLVQEGPNKPNWILPQAGQLPQQQGADPVGGAGGGSGQPKAGNAYVRKIQG
eukprot:9914881-Karenia_brevis.AAC.1